MPEALWITGRGRCALRQTPLAQDARLVEIEALFSGISRGTERLVFEGRVPKSEYARMRAPFQAGDFPFPVKYGYAAVGRVVDGPPALRGRSVFALHPHQDRFRVPADGVHVLPDDLPAGRAVLAANMETALNIVWDARAAPGDRIAIVGGGVVGALAAWLCARLPGAEVALVDVDAGRRALAERLRAGFALAGEAPRDCDVVIHASGNPTGLQTAIDAAGEEARIVEASWYGDRAADIGLGGAFHSRRLQIVSSQVGKIAPARRSRWDNRRRMATALTLLASDPALDGLVSGETRFADLANDYPRVLADPATLCHRIAYSEK